MGIEVIFALGLFGMLMVVASLNGISQFFRHSEYNTDITFQND